MTITENAIMEYECYLQSKGRSTSTIKKYLHAVNQFAAWLGEQPLTAIILLEWRAYLEGQMAPTSVNAELAAINGFLHACGKADFCVAYLKVQRRVFRDESRDLTDEEYRRLVRAANKPRIELILQTLCSTGIRVLELNILQRKQYSRDIP